MTAKCLNCGSGKLIQYEEDCATREYECLICGFSFDDDDLYDLSGQVKVELYRQQQTAQSDDDRIEDRDERDYFPPTNGYGWL